MKKQDSCFLLQWTEPGQRTSGCLWQNVCTCISTGTEALKWMILCTDFAGIIYRHPWSMVATEAVQELLVSAKRIMHRVMWQSSNIKTENLSNDKKKIWLEFVPFAIVEISLAMYFFFSDSPCKLHFFVSKVHAGPPFEAWDLLHSEHKEPCCPIR